MRLRCGPGSIVDGLTVSGQAQCWQQMARACGVRLWCAAVVCGCGMCGCGVAWTCQRIFCACVKNTAAVHLAIKVSLPCLGVRLSDIRAVHDKLDQLLLLCHTFRRGVQRCNGVESGHARYVAADQHRRAPYSSSAGLNQTARQGHILNIPSLVVSCLTHKIDAPLPQHFLQLFGSHARQDSFFGSCFSPTARLHGSSNSFVFPKSSDSFST